MASRAATSRQIIIGDVHGCFDELKELLKKINYQNQATKDQLFFVGDLINKGPKSLEVLQLAYQEGAVCVKGNHEMAFLEYVQTPYQERKVNPSFDQLIHQMADQLDFWIKEISAWPYFHHHDNFLLVHAGVVPDIAVEKTPHRFLCTMRTWDGRGFDLKNENNPAWYQLYHGEKMIIYGHWAKEGLNVRSKTIGLDSGCVYGKKLSCLIFPSKEIVQVNAQKAYQEIKGPKAASD